MPPKKKPLGQPLPLTPEQAAEAAQIQPQDINQARAAWMSNAPPWAVGLIEAQRQEGL